MNTEGKKQQNGFFKRFQAPRQKKGKRALVIVIDKRQKFVIAIVFLSLLLFFTEYQFGRSGIITPFILALFTDIFLFWAIRNDVKENFTWNVFILPFIYSLAFGLFYFLVPGRILFRMVLTLLYAFGLYSLYLSENIFTVASIRTIALLSGARIVSFVLTLLSFFFLANIIFTLHLFILPTVIAIAIFAFPLINQSVWSYTLERSSRESLMWVGCLALCVVEAAAVLWFWPSSPTVIALFLAGFFYTLVGLIHVWLEKRLFRGVMWEYLWVGVIVFFVLMLFSNWGK